MTHLCYLLLIQGLMFSSMVDSGKLNTLDTAESAESVTKMENERVSFHCSVLDKGK